MPLINNGQHAVIGRKVTTHSGQPGCGCGACENRKKFESARPVRNEGSQREAYLRQLDEKYSPTVVDSLLKQIVSMSLQPVSGTAKAYMDEVVSNAFNPFDIEDFSMEPAKRQTANFTFNVDPFARPDLTNTNEFEDFEMPKR